MNRMQHEAAFRIFSEVRETEPYHPLAPLGTLANEWIVNQEKIGYKAGNKELINDIEGVTTEYRKRMVIDPDNPELRYYLGLTMGMRARVQLSEKNWVGVLINGYKVIRYIKSALEKSPDNPDIIIAFGVFNYYVGLSSGFMQIASWILQMSGSREEGLEQIQQAALEGNYSRYEARSLLAFIYLYLEGDYILSNHWASMLEKEFPENPYYSFLLAESELQTGNSRIETHINKISDCLDDLNPYAKSDYIQRLQLLNGTKALLEDDLETAERELTQFIENFESELDYDLASGYLRLGQVYDLQGKRLQAIAQYRLVIDLDNRTVAVRQAKFYLEEPFVIKN
ncbi:MAG: hypothetical protein KAU06_01745, partial [Candidatus Marinimicrobia bacterium]|nr:hypothetical protein [Candidatus Neomarinimicrobiota bacterium]